MNIKFVYADNAATTAVNPKVINKMMPYLTQHYGNPSSIYKISEEPRRAIEEAREIISKSIGASSSKEIFFTASGSEADNWAIKGYAMRMKKLGKNHIITSSVEHHAVLQVVRRGHEGFLTVALHLGRADPTATCRAHPVTGVSHRSRVAGQIGSDGTHDLLAGLVWGR